MKYIRTKDGVYELNPPDYESPMCLDGKTITTCVYTKNQEWVAKSDILKQSDIIEELFDWIFLRVDGKIREVYKTYDDAVIAEGNDIVRYEILGVIETDKGLIYVAKMNDEVEFELK